MRRVYVQRAFIYPFGLRDKWKPMPAVVCLMGAVFNIGNAYLNGRYLFDLSGDRYQADWLASPQFLLGLVFFVAGFVINRQADGILQACARRASLAIRSPMGVCTATFPVPTILAKLWNGGWAIASLSLPGLAFALWTFANLAPRARAHQKWYHQNFEQYPQERKALIPGVW